MIWQTPASDFVDVNVSDIIIVVLGCVTIQRAVTAANTQGLCFMLVIGALTKGLKP